jgi:hypothetical protein
LPDNRQHHLQSFASFLCIFFWHSCIAQASGSECPMLLS